MAFTTIDNPELYFQTKLYTGTGSSHAITLDGSENMQPDWVWIKRRNSAGGHMLTDVIRGVTKTIITNETGAEQTFSNGLTAFGSDGFTVGSEDGFNASSDTFVAWNWKAGTSFSNDASSTGVGTIDSTGSINTTAGFSIISYTGTGSNGTIAHGLGAVPRWIIIKVRDTNNNWIVQHGSLGATKRMLLDLDYAESTQAFFNNTEPTSSVFSVGTVDLLNNSGNAYIAYLFAEKKGYSKFSSYTGNGNADGPFVYTGFAVAWLMMKRTDSAGEWLIYDNKRDSFNLRDTRLEAQDNFADSTGTTKVFDFLSNGFKCRGSDADINASGGTYIYMAFAESPFVNSNGVPTNAR